MFDTFEEVAQNKYIRSLNTICDKFGIYSAYLSYNAIDKKKSGVYFLMGFDKNKIYDKRLNIEKLINDVSKDRKYLHLDILPIKLTDCNTFAVHQNVSELCRHFEFLQCVYNEYYKPLPNKISHEGVACIEMLYLNAVNPELNKYFGMYNSMLRQYLDDIEDSRTNPNNALYKKEQYIMNGFNDVSLSKAQNNIRMNAGSNTGQNKVSIEQFVREVVSCGKMELRAACYNEFKKEMDKRPEILYWCSEPEKIKFRLPKGQGFGPKKEDNDFSRFFVLFDKTYEKEITIISYKLNYPQAFKYSKEELISEEKVSSVAIMPSDFNNFMSLCFSNNVKFAINNDRISEDDELPCIYVFVKNSDIAMVDKITSRLSKEAEEFHIYTFNKELYKPKEIEEQKRDYYEI